jgi:hypothetical protein
MLTDHVNKPKYMHNNLSTMQKPIAFIIAFLFVAPIIVAIAASPASAKDIVTIPLNESVQISPNLKANLIQVTISDTTYGASYAEDPGQVIYPILVYTYQNVGSVPESGHLHIKFLDDQGQVYEKRDEGTFDTVKPGATTASRLIEVNIPKDRRVTELIIVQGFNQQTIHLEYPGSPTSAPTSTPATPSASPTGSPGGICAGALLLPLTIIGIAWTGLRLSRK